MVAAKNINCRISNSKTCWKLFQAFSQIIIVRITTSLHNNNNTSVIFIYWFLFLYFFVQQKGQRGQKPLKLPYWHSTPLHTTPKPNLMEAKTNKVMLCCTKLNCARLKWGFILKVCGSYISNHMCEALSSYNLWLLVVSIFSAKCSLLGSFRKSMSISLKDTR